MNNNKIKINNDKKNNYDNNLNTTKKIDSKIKNKKVNVNNKDKKEFNFNEIKSVDGYDCIGPCYPPNTVYYNPSSLVSIQSQFATCPINKKEINVDGNKKIIYADKCNISDINDEYLYFDIFDDSVKIANSSDNFLKQIYNIYDIEDVIHFLNDSLDLVPIYTQKRLLKAVFEVYYKYIEFPKNFFSVKIIKILTDIYKLNTGLTSKEVIKDLDKINSNTLDIYNYFIKKYSN